MAEVIRVAILGPESTGKTTLARDLAAHYSTTWAPEFLREWVEANPGRDPAVGFDDTAVIALAHAAREDERVASAHRVVFFDTDIVVSVVYAEHYLGRVHPTLEALAASRRVHRTLVLAPDVPWVSDAVRDRPHAREALFDRMCTELVARGRAFDVIRGDWAARWAAATAVVDAMLADPHAP